MESISIATLPSEIVYEILSRTSLETLKRSSILSKETNALTYESLFSNLHCQRTNTLRGVYLQGYRRGVYKGVFVSSSNDENQVSNLSLDFLAPVDREDTEIVASSKQGIFLCVNSTVRRRSPRYMVCKLTTRQYQVIPNPKTKYYTSGIGMVVIKSNPLRFKILRISTWRGDYFHEVFDSDLWYWKQLGRINILGIESRVPASISGTLNWLTTKGNIFSYDLHEDSSRFIELPNDGSVNNNLQLIDYEGKLGLNVQDREQHYCGELWIFSQNIWTRQHSINLKPLEERTCNILSVCNSDVVLVKYCLWAVAFYDFKKGITLRTQDLNHHVPDCAFHFESDFELFDLKRPTYTPTPDEKIRRQGKRTKTQQKEYGFSI